MSQRIHYDWSPGVASLPRAGEAAPPVQRFWRLALPLLAGLFMLAASFIPWLVDPLGRPMMAWQLPLEFGWQIPTAFWSGLVNYGLLCLCCALLSWWLAWRVWRKPGAALVGTGVTTRDCQFVALLCLLPVALLITQVLYMDMGGMMDLANKETQLLLIRSKFGYGTPTQFILLLPFDIDPLTLDSRVALLLNQLTGGAFVPFFSTITLLAAQRLFPRPARRPLARRVIAGSAVLGLTMVLLLGRTPLALACTFEADHLLMGGEYAQALRWLDSAVWLNPSLDLVPGYHIMRGQAAYFLHPDQPTAESMAYRAAFYRQQNDLLGAYQQLLIARQYAPRASWLLAEARTTLTRLAEMTHPLRGPLLGPRLNNERRSLTWLNVLIQADPTNVYAHYAVGRIFYDMNDYASCERQMFIVLALSSSSEVRSSAYTYLGLSQIQQGDILTARDYLFQAQALDIEFRNNTARQALSGLR